MDLRGELGSLAERTAGTIRRRRLSLERGAALRRALPLFLVFPIVATVYQGVRYLVGAGAAPWPLWVLLLGTATLPLLWFAVELLRAWSRAVPRRLALATVDHELRLKDRLQSADEFLGAAQPSPFMLAAIEDAESRVEQARRAELASATAGASSIGLRWLCLVLAGAIGVFAFWLGDQERLRVSSPSEAIENRAVAGLQGLEPEKDHERNDTPPIAEEQARSEAPDARERSPESPGKAVEMASEELKESKGSAGLGRSAEASAAQGASRSQAVPSNQAQASKSEPENARAQKKPKEPKPSPPRKPAEKKPGEEASATSARGSSKGSNRNPSTSDWVSRDHVPSDEEKLLENDEEIEDEDEEQESRGGIQPNLRDRKPPVNRDLRIGFGNRKNPDANGRGGPSEQKKSRGVASLVLGVPIPDRVKGQPNPGRTKITQERIEPQADLSDRIDAEAREARNRPIGHLTPRPLPPWMRSLVRSYFLSRRSEADDS